MHWTYEAFDEDSGLHQGDILKPDETLVTLFDEVHPHFANPKYRGFLILSQSCDLVKRSGKCSATHISLSVIRSLEDIISDSLKDRFGYLAPGIYDKRRKKAVKDLVERLVNQNENALGLFYLHPCIDSGIIVRSAAILRVSISVKASMHYEKLLNARIGRLSSQFQSKLGWMVGNLYSRVGVPDWKEKSANNEEELLKEILSFSVYDEPLWVEKKQFMRLLKDKPGFSDLSVSEQKSVIDEYQPSPPKEKILEIIVNTVSNAVPKIKKTHINQIKQHLRNNEKFDAQMRRFGQS